MNVRAVRREECGRIAAIHARCFDKGWPSAELARFVTDPSVIALCDNDVDGFILLRCAAGEAEILTLAVDPGRQGRGIGERLVLAALAATRNCEVTRCFLEVSARNPAAAALYRKAGFSLCGMRQGYYADGSDAHLMEKTLGE